MAARTIENCIIRKRDEKAGDNSIPIYSKEGKCMGPASCIGKIVYPCATCKYYYGLPKEK